MILPSWYQTQHDALLASAVQMLQTQRQLAHQLCLQSGLPNTRSSFWQYTDLSAWLRQAGEDRAAPNESFSEAKLAGMQPLVFDGQSLAVGTEPLSDGMVCHRLIENEDVWSELSSVYDLAIRDGMSAMNWALSEDVYWLRIPANVTVRLPIALMHQMSDAWSKPSTQVRLFIEVGAGSQVVFYEMFQGQAHARWHQVHVQWQLHEGASVRLYHQQSLSSGSCAIHHDVCQASHACFKAAVFNRGANHARCVIENTLQGDHAQCHILGLSQSGAQQHYDFVVRSKHIGKATKSRVQHRALVSDQAVAAFNAKVLVKDTAPGSHAQQSNQNLLLSDRARVHAKPALEIYHDDVVCSHGATVGTLSEEALFFLRSRGIAVSQARAMLTEAFCQSIVDQLWDRDAQDLWQNLLTHDSNEASQVEVCDAA